MKYQGNFKFLKVEQMKRKNSEELAEADRTFFVIHLLDEDNNPVRFFVFNKDLMSKIANAGLVSLQDIIVEFTISCGTNGWNVNLVDIA